MGNGQQTTAKTKIYLKQFDVQERGISSYIYTMPVPANVGIQEPWAAFADGPEDQARATKIAERLKKDLPNGHVLSGLELKAVARRNDQDDVLFEVFGGDQPLAVVHVTWQRETDPRWPSTKFFQSWDEWVDKVMRPDHDGLPG